MGANKTPLHIPNKDTNILQNIKIHKLLIIIEIVAFNIKTTSFFGLINHFNIDLL